MKRMELTRSGYYDVPAGKVAAVVTSLEMRVRPASTTARVAPAGWTLTREARPDVQEYRRLYRAIGESWLWFSRLQMSADEVAQVIHDPKVEVCFARFAGRMAGLLELDFRVEGECELSFLGLVPDAIGAGVGRWMMSEGIARAWTQPIHRFWVHTCSLDVPSAVSFYQSVGFQAFRRQVEIADDPRLLGLHPESAAPQVPLIR
jgi:GNAT superfamily N-acetyltransferase